MGDLVLVTPGRPSLTPLGGGVLFDNSSCRNRMPKSTQKPGFRLSSIPEGVEPVHKLAQLGTESPEVLTDDSSMHLNPQSRFSAKGAFQKRARVKYLTSALSVRLANVPDTPLIKSYWNTFYCSSIMQKKGEHLVAKFCKNRWCLVCNRIRTAQLIKQYLPTIQSWDDKHFVTLTVPNCSADDLEATIAEMKSVSNRIRETLKKQYQRKQRATPLVGLRKLEVTYNPTRKDYHPHFHFVVSNRETADDLRCMWLSHFQKAKWQGQDVRKADDRSSLEMFKYFVKLVSSHSKDRLILVDPLDVIFQAVAGERTFQAFNVKVGKMTTDEEADALADELATEAVYRWEQSVTDWVDIETGEGLTGYQPDEQFRELVEKRIILATTPKNLS
jgi:hypothetical protein